MKFLNWMSVSAVFLVFSSILCAKDENGLRVEVQKTTLSKEDTKGMSSYSWDDKIDRTLGLKISLKNISMKEMPEGELKWVIIVERWGYSSRRFERYTGQEKIPPLLPGESANLVAGSSQLGGYKNYNNRYQDKLETWKVDVVHEGKTTLSSAGSTSFDRINEKAKDVVKSN